jgi:hypothetical protein
MATSKEVRKLAKGADVYVDTWSPGDGITRYRFAGVPGSYFEWSSVTDTLTTCLGARDALEFLHGVVAGRRLEREQKSKT